MKGRRIASIMKELEHDRVDILKMDIEGAEFDVLEELVASGANVSQIIVDFHNRYLRDGKDKLKRCLKTMDNAGYKIFAINEYNEAISFIKNVT